MSARGIQIRNNMCSCPFHGDDKHPSMKVFDDGANCFTCGWNGDIFSFVMRYDGVGFKEAYRSLGGDYSPYKTDNARTLSNMRRDSEKAVSESKKAYYAEVKRAFNESLVILRTVLQVYEPLSDEWCEAYNTLQYMEYLYEVKYLDEQEINDFYVYRKCRAIRYRFL